MSNAERQSSQTRHRNTQNRRSAAVSFGRSPADVSLPRFGDEELCSPVAVRSARGTSNPEWERKRQKDQHRITAIFQRFGILGRGIQTLLVGPTEVGWIYWPVVVVAAGGVVVAVPTPVTDPKILRNSVKSKPAPTKNPVRKRLVVGKVATSAEVPTI